MIHTESTPGTVGTCRLISEGWTKMEAPMMIPATMAVACSRLMGRSSDGRSSGVAKWVSLSCEAALADPVYVKTGSGRRITFF